MDDVFEYAKKLEGARRETPDVKKVSYSPRLLEVMVEGDVDKVLKHIEEVGYGREEVYGTLEVLCRFRRDVGGVLREAIDKYFGGGR